MIHIVDDEEISLRLAESICQTLSLEARAWRNSSDFLQSAASVFATEDILLLDVYMPGSDAIDVLTFFYDQKRSVRLVLVSGYNSETLTLTASLAEALGHQLIAKIRKPLAINDLRDGLGAGAGPDNILRTT
jgi:FixJ family two-component response regulator